MLYHLADSILIRDLVLWKVCSCLLLLSTSNIDPQMTYNLIDSRNTVFRMISSVSILLHCKVCIEFRSTRYRDVVFAEYTKSCAWLHEKMYNGVKPVDLRGHAIGSLLPIVRRATIVYKQLAHQLTNMEKHHPVETAEAPVIPVFWPQHTNGMFLCDSHWLYFVRERNRIRVSQVSSYYTKLQLLGRMPYLYDWTRTPLTSVPCMMLVDSSIGLKNTFIRE